MNIFFIQCLKLHEHICHELDLVLVVHEHLTRTVIRLIEKFTHFIVNLLCCFFRISFNARPLMHVRSLISILIICNRT